MKNAIVPGVIIGLLSGVWLFIMRAMGLSFSNDTVNPIEFVSVLIPIIGLYYGVKVYCYKELGGQMNFLEGLVHSFKILIVSGIFVVFIGIIYINYIDFGDVNWKDFSGRIFAALLIGVLSSLAVSLLVMTKSKKLIKKLFHKYFELIFWIAAIAALAFADPAGPAHFSLCPFKAVGFTWCPGCGLGHSISWLFHGNIANSWHAHWLGAPALGIILYRIYQLVRLKVFNKSALPAV